ncbi:MAG: hypothetical protein JWM11_6994 [Planctomycetaceae bacterium]|nr:hypothetical protein [Planctomycetaceae bacterium]
MRRGQVPGVLRVDAALYGTEMETLIICESTVTIIEFDHHGFELRESLFQSNGGRCRATALQGQGMRPRPSLLNFVCEQHAAEHSFFDLDSHTFLAIRCVAPFRDIDSIQQASNGDSRKIPQSSKLFANPLHPARR